MINIYDDKLVTFDYIEKKKKRNNLLSELLNSDKCDMTTIDEIENSENDYDCIINVEKQFIRKVTISNNIICEISNDKIQEKIKHIKKDVFLYTSLRDWIWLKNRVSYTVEIEGVNKNVLIGEICDYSVVLENTCLKDLIDEDDIEELKKLKECKSIKIIYGRCVKSMYLLDDIHRKYIDNLSLSDYNIVGIKSVAGSGKTTTLLNLTKKYHNKRVLYIAFNKSLITEIKGKVKKERIKNLHPKTFDALMYELYTFINKKAPVLNFNFKPQFIGNILPSLNDKSFYVKKYYCENLIEFCKHPEINDVDVYSKKILKKNNDILKQLWSKVEEEKLITFDTIRKQCFIHKWLKNYIDDNYDIILIDETQDFDMIMLKMLLNDTTIPKIFVGDPKQAIYQFRGCINAFNYLPSNSLIIEFYSSFRVGNPLCDNITKLFTDCWMIPKSKYNTTLVKKFEEDDKYTYLFRTWRSLLTIAQNTTNIWVNDFNKKYDMMLNLHSKFSKIKNINEDEFEDDLPSFLKSLTLDELKKILNGVLKNTVSEKSSKIKFYTVHSYKGLEDNNIRLSNDIKEEDENVYYVALTRCKKKIMIDES